MKGSRSKRGADFHILSESFNFSSFSFVSRDTCCLAHTLLQTCNAALCGSDSLIIGHAIRTFWFTFPKCGGQATIRLLYSGVYLFYEMTWGSFVYHSNSEKAS